MAERLIDITTGKLLEKFGAGNHKPGSGSASAFQGMLAAQMLRTVIDLTLEPKRKSIYQSHIPELLNIKRKIDERIYPNLKRLFQVDSDQFDYVINLRIQRDNEIELKSKRTFTASALEALITSTETPLDIAELCIELASFAVYVFNHGFKSARGDSGVAINCAVSGISCCLFIVELNLISLPVNQRTEATRQRKAGIKLLYEKLSESIIDNFNVLENESAQNRNFQKNIAAFQRGNLADNVISNSDIENIVRQLQNTMWLQRECIWKNKTIKNPLGILEVDKVLEKVMGYTFQKSNSLGIHEQDRDIFEIAGIINKNEKLVQVSKRFPEETQNFTAAHELGHAILHRRAVLHRDRPLDGSTIVPRSLEEMQADKFAAFFLMPAKLVEDIFFEIFETPKFTINESSVLAIKGASIATLRRKCQNKRGLARLLSNTEYYDAKAFACLSKTFKVSTETMAIRLEELDLLEF